uniref:Cytochrome b-c1 complex subunit 7 n=1 Tax=Salvator merianae TaxID=96440 RepID=A0A8D0BUE1_SALMN
MAARPPAAAGGRLLEGFRKWYYSAAGFNKLGLLRDDTLYENPDVKEALKRLPEDVYYERLFRIKRALDLSMKHQILPKEQWVKYEEVGIAHQKNHPVPVKPTECRATKILCASCEGWGYGVRKIESNFEVC